MLNSTNLKVGGSNPSGRAITTKHLSKSAAVRDPKGYPELFRMPDKIRNITSRLSAIPFRA